MDADLEHASSVRSVAAQELQRFREIRQLHNHWARKTTRRAYYWYLTFEHCTELQSLAQRCRDGIPLPYYDFTPLAELHMTLERVAFDGDIGLEQIDTIVAAAAQACSALRPFTIAVAGLGGTPGALGFSVVPHEPLRALRDTLREATLSAYPQAPVRPPGFHPHVAIAYCNSDVPATQAITAVERLSPLDIVTVPVSQVALVVIERRSRAYSWHAVTQIPLAGASPPISIN
ncbi:2'-5' RNA ligase family protein [Dactylosporangium sp. CA-092794]|uniref:2'-5' RNA ligase family protein n=1 Tax=Dactylosporangium sp. CA-092794 TaxID=3239929 RepID=UPI003D8FED1D